MTRHSAGHSGQANGQILSLAAITSKINSIYCRRTNHELRVELGRLLLLGRQHLSAAEWRDWEYRDLPFIKGAAYTYGQAHKLN